MLRVAIRGALGRMGREACEAVRASEDLELACELDLDSVLENELGECSVDLALDFTRPDALDAGVPVFLGRGIATVVGTSGVTDTQKERWDKLARASGTGILVVPNFCLGVILMQAFCDRAARYYPDVEILETHHENKVDSPSGTAADTAQRMGRIQKEYGLSKLAHWDPVPYRGGQVAGVPVHSLRLPGTLAKQTVVFGGPGETLSVEHETKDRAAFMPGVLLALRHVKTIAGLQVGLEHCLGLTD